MQLAYNKLRRRFSASLSGALILSALLFTTLDSSWAQDADGLRAGKPNPAYPPEAQITFQWNYTCPANISCNFRCPGAGGVGGAEHVIRLDLYLGSLPTSDEGQRALAVFYDFTTREFPHGNGFSISAGINSLSCQVTGLRMDYSGPPPKKSKPLLPEETPKPLPPGEAPTGNISRSNG
jgi:hypothetical protein